MKNNHNNNETKNRILSAAKDHFFIKGYEATRLEDIVRQAQVSKTSIYKIFGGKRELFLALNENFLDESLRAIRAAKPQGATSLEEVRVSLNSFGENYLKIITQKDRLALLRLNICQANNINETALDYYNAGPRAVVRILTEFFMEIKKLNVLNIQCEQTAATQFAAMLRGNYLFRALLDTTFELSLNAIQTHVKAAVSLFINGYQRQS